MAQLDQLINNLRAAGFGGKDLDDLLMLQSYRNRQNRLLGLTNQASTAAELQKIYQAGGIEDDEVKWAIEQRAQNLGVDARFINKEADDFSLFRTFVSGPLLGLIEGITTLPVGIEPRNTSEQISSSIGHLAGFTGLGLLTFLSGGTYGAGMTATGTALRAMSGAARLTGATARVAGAGLKSSKAMKLATMSDKAVTGLASIYPKAAKFRSVPMWAADKVMGSQAFSAASRAASGYLGNSAMGHYTRQALKSSAHLGIASGVSSVWHGPSAMMDATIHGAIAGGMFKTIPHIPGLGGSSTVHKTLRGLTGATLMTAPEVARGNEDVGLLVYNALLGAYFGWKEMPWYRQKAVEYVQDQHAVNKVKPYLVRQLPETRRWLNSFGENAPKVEKALNEITNELGTVKDVPEIFRRVGEMLPKADKKLMDINVQGMSEVEKYEFNIQRANDMQGFFQNKENQIRTLAEAEVDATRKQEYIKQRQFFTDIIKDVKKKKKKLYKEYEVAAKEEKRKPRVTNTNVNKFGDVLFKLQNKFESEKDQVQAVMEYGNDLIKLSQKYPASFERANKSLLEQIEKDNLFAKDIKNYIDDNANKKFKETPKEPLENAENQVDLNSRYDYNSIYDYNIDVPIFGEPQPLKKLARYIGEKRNWGRQEINDQIEVMARHMEAAVSEYRIGDRVDANAKDVIWSKFSEGLKDSYKGMEGVNYKEVERMIDFDLKRSFNNAIQQTKVRQISYDVNDKVVIPEYSYTVQMDPVNIKAPENIFTDLIYKHNLVGQGEAPYMQLRTVQKNIGEVTDPATKKVIVPGEKRDIDLVEAKLSDADFATITNNIFSKGYYPFGGRDATPVINFLPLNVRKGKQYEIEKEAFFKALEETGYGDRKLLGEAVAKEAEKLQMTEAQVMDMVISNVNYWAMVNSKFEPGMDLIATKTEYKKFMRKGYLSSLLNMNKRSQIIFTNMPKLDPKGNMKFKTALVEDYAVELAKEADKRKPIDLKAAQAYFGETTGNLPYKEGSTLTEEGFAFKRLVEHAGSERDRLVKKYKKEWEAHRKSTRDPDRADARIINKYLKELTPEARNYFEYMSPGKEQEYQMASGEYYFGRHPDDKAIHGSNLYGLGEQLDALKQFTYPKRVVNEEYFLPMSDGGITMEENAFISMARAVGVPENAGFAQAWIQLPHPELGLLVTKAAIHRATPTMSAEMRNKGVDQLIPESAAKQYGARKLGKESWTEEGLKLENAEIFEVSGKDISIELNRVYDDPMTNLSEPSKLLRQIIMNNTEELAGSKHITESQKFLESYAIGKERANEVFDSYIHLENKSTEDAQRLLSSVKIDDLSIHSINQGLKSKDPYFEKKFWSHAAKTMLVESGRVGYKDDITSGELLRMAEENLKDVTYLDRLLPVAHISAARLMKFASPMFNKIYLNYFLKRVTQPIVESSGHGVLRKLDSRLQYKLKKAGYDIGSKEGREKLDRVFFLDEGWKEWKNWATKKEKKENGVAANTLAEAFQELHNSTGGKYNWLKSKLEAIVARVPIAEFSGSQVLQFGGWTGAKGTGIMISPKNMERLSGADLDIDGAYFFFNPGKRGWEGFRTPLREHRKQQDTMKDYSNEFIRKNKDLEYQDDYIGMFLPWHRIQMAQTVMLGRGAMIQEAQKTKIILNNMLTEALLDPKRSLQSTTKDGKKVVFFADKGEIKTKVAPDAPSELNTVKKGLTSLYEESKKWADFGQTDRTGIEIKLSDVEKAYWDGRKLVTRADKKIDMADAAEQAQRTHLEAFEELSAKKVYDDKRWEWLHLEDLSVKIDFLPKENKINFSFMLPKQEYNKADVFDLIYGAVEATQKKLSLSLDTPISVKTMHTFKKPFTKISDIIGLPAATPPKIVSSEPGALFRAMAKAATSVAVDAGKYGGTITIPETRAKLLEAAFPEITVDGVKVVDYVKFVENTLEKTTYSSRMETRKALFGKVPHANAEKILDVLKEHPSTDLSNLGFFARSLEDIFVPERFMSLVDVGGINTSPKTTNLYRAFESINQFLKDANTGKYGPESKALVNSIPLAIKQRFVGVPTETLIKKLKSAKHYGLENLNSRRNIANNEDLWPNVVRGLKPELIPGSKKFEKILIDNYTPGRREKWLEKQMESLDAMLSDNLSDVVGLKAVVKHALSREIPLGISEEYAIAASKIRNDFAAHQKMLKNRNSLINHFNKMEGESIEVFDLARRAKKHGETEEQSLVRARAFLNDLANKDMVHRIGEGNYKKVGAIPKLSVGLISTDLARNTIKDYRGYISEQSKRLNISEKDLQDHFDFNLLSTFKLEETAKRGETSTSRLSFDSVSIENLGKYMNEYNQFFNDVQMGATMQRSIEDWGVQNKKADVIKEAEKTQVRDIKKELLNVPGLGTEYSTIHGDGVLSARGQKVWGEFVKELEIFRDKMGDQEWITQDGIFGMLKGFGQGARPQDITLEDVAGFTNRMKYWRKGFGVIDWLSSLRKGKKDEVRWKHWFQFTEKVADEMYKKDLFLVAKKNTLNMVDETTGHVQKVYGDMWVPMNHMHKLLHHSNNAIDLGSAAAEKFQHALREDERLGMLQTIESLTNKKEYNDDLFRLAVKKNAYEGANKHYNEVDRLRNTSDPTDSERPSRYEVNKARERMFLEKQRYEKELEDTVIKKEEQFAFTKGADERVTMDRDGMVKEIAEKLNHTFNDLRFNLIEMDPKYEKKNIVYKKKNFYDSRDLDLNTTWNNLLSQIMESSILKEPIKLDAIRLLANEYNFSEYAKRSAEDYMTELPGRNLKSEFDNILRSSIEHDGLYNDFIRVSNRWKSKRDHIADRKFDRMQTYTRTLMRLFNSTKTDRADIIRTATPEMRRSAKGYGFVEAVKTWRKLNNNSEEVKLPESVVELFESGQISSILRNAKIYSWETMLKSGKLTRAKAEEFLRAKSRYESTEYTLKRNPNTKEESIELKPTGYIEGYWPHMDWDPKVLEAQRDAAIEQVKGSTLSNSAKGEKIQRINEHFSHLRAVDQAPDMMLNIAEANMITNRDAILEKSVRQAKQLDLTAAIERKPGAAMKRTADLDGFSYRYDVIEKYIRQINKAIYTKAGGMLARRTIESFEQKAPMGEQTQNWGDYFRIYARDVLGYPSLIPEHIYSAKKGEPLHDPLNLKYAPYRVLSDENVMNFGTPKVGKDGEPVYDRNGIQKYEGGSKLNKVFTKLYGWKARVTRQERRDFKKKNGRDMTQEEIEAVYKERMADFQPADIAAISNLESKYEMASLLAHSKTGLNNILGGTANTWIWSGSKHLWNSWKMDELRKINREWKNMDDVHRTLSEWGVIEEMMVHELNLHKEFSIPKYRRFADDVLDYLKRDPNASDKTLMQIAKDNNISQSFMDKAAWFMRKSERVLRSRAFLASYMQAREQLLPVVLEYNNDYLIQRGKEGVKATQFLYTASYRPAFARTSAGKIFSRLKLWGWNSMKFRREVYQAAKFTGMNPNTEEFERFQRMLFSDSLMIGLASLIPFSMFDYGLPSPYSQMQAFGQWLFGATDEEKSRAFYGELPTAIAPLSEVVPVILRTPVNLFSALFTSDNWVQTANYYIWASFPFGRIGKDVWRSMQNPIMLPEHMTGIPFRRLQYLSKQYKDKKFRSYTPFYNPLEQEEEEE